MVRKSVNITAKNGDMEVSVQVSLKQISMKTWHKSTTETASKNKELATNGVYSALLGLGFNASEIKIK